MTSVSTKELAGLPVIGGKKQKRLGKVRHFVFYPKGNRVAGFLVHRPDAALMFKRKDIFVQVNGFDVESGKLVIRDDPTSTDNAACKALGLDLDQSVLWVGMPVMTSDGTLLGFVDEVLFQPYSGDVDTIVLEEGQVKGALLGKRRIPAELIEGFKRGQGIALVGAHTSDAHSDARIVAGDTVPHESTDESFIPATQRGAIVVHPSAAELEIQGGAADVAGRASVIIANAAKTGAAKAKRETARARVKVRAAADTVAQQLETSGVEIPAGEQVKSTIDKGAYAAGEHAAKIRGMFSAFKEEFQKGLNGDYDDET